MECGRSRAGGGATIHAQSLDARGPLHTVNRWAVGRLGGAERRHVVHQRRAASAIGEVVHYNVFETLTKIERRWVDQPLLAQSWSVTPDNKTWAFKLSPASSSTTASRSTPRRVKFSFERAVATKARSTRTRRSSTTSSNIASTDDLHGDPDAEESESRLPVPARARPRRRSSSPRARPPTTRSRWAPGRYKLESWNKGASVVLARWDGYRDAKAVKLEAGDDPLHQRHRRASGRRCCRATSMRSRGWRRRAAWRSFRATSASRC